MKYFNAPPLPTYEELVELDIEGYSSFKSFETRFERIQKYGFPIIHDQTILHLSKFLQNKRVVEIGSGNGYLAYHLEQAGINITAVNDNRGDHYYTLDWKNYYYKRDRVEDSKHRYYYYNRYNCIILSWPDYEDDLAYIVAKRMKKGQFLIYEGESKCGCTANNDFFDYTDKNFYNITVVERLLNQKHLQYFGIHDYWHVMRKKC